MMRPLTHALVLFSLCWAASCTPKTEAQGLCFGKRGDPTGKKLVPEFAHGYFPPQYGRPTIQSSEGPIATISDIEAEWFPDVLHSAAEKSLFAQADCENPPALLLRFTYIPSFNHPVVIHLRSEAGGIEVVAKELTGLGGYNPGHLGRTKAFRLTPAQAAALHRKLDEGELFNQDAALPGFGIDGSRWVFEMVDKHGYRLVKRWSPDEDDQANVLGQFLIGLTGWKIEAY